MTEDIKKWEERGGPQPESETALMVALNRGYSPELIEKMMDLAERQEKNEARKAYVRDMAKFKANPPEILKTKHVSYKNSKNQVVEWNHAELGEICDAIVAGLSPHNFYHRWDREQTEGIVKTTCIITHDQGHSEQTSMSAPPDISGGKDALKAAASTDTVQQRLTLLALTGLAAKGMDNDATGEIEEDFISVDQAKKLHKLIESCGPKADWLAGKILELNKIETMDTLPAFEFDRVVLWINKHKAKMDVEKGP